MQLDLFTVRHDAPMQTATVYRFPLCRRADLVRETASELLSRPHAEGKRYWSRHVRELRRNLRSAGMRSADVDAEIRDYSQAVRIEALSSQPLRVSR